MNEVERIIAALVTTVLVTPFICEGARRFFTVWWRLTKRHAFGRSNAKSNEQEKLS